MIHFCKPAHFDQTQQALLAQLALAHKGKLGKMQPQVLDHQQWLAMLRESLQTLPARKPLTTRFDLRVHPLHAGAADGESGGALGFRLALAPLDTPGYAH